MILGIQSYLKCFDEDLDFGCVFLHNIFIVCWSRKFKSKAKWTIFLCKCSVDNVHSISTNQNKIVICSYFKLCKSYITLHFKYCSMFSNNGVPFLKCQQYSQEKNQLKILITNLPTFLTHCKFVCHVSPTIPNFNYWTSQITLIGWLLLKMSSTLCQHVKKCEVINYNTWDLIDKNPWVKELNSSLPWTYAWVGKNPIQ